MLPPSKRLDNSPAAGKYDLQTVLLHEMGHLLGFNAAIPSFVAHVGTIDGSQLFVGPDFTAKLTPGPDNDHLDSSSYEFDLMNATLTPSVRKLPSALDVQIINAVRDSSRLNPISQEATAALLNYRSSALWGTSTTTILNGDFGIASPAATGFGWTTTGTVAVSQGEAALSENQQVFSGLSQAFTVPTGATSLRFTITGAHFVANGSTLPDAFEAALVDANTGVSLIAAIGGVSNTDAFFNLQSNGKAYFAPEVSVLGVAASGQTATTNAPLVVTVSLQGIAVGTQAKIHFDLLGFGATGSVVSIDNVQLLGPEGNHAPVGGADSYQTRQGVALQVNAGDGVLFQ